MSMAITYLVANLLHGFVGLAWILGLRRVAGALSPAMWVRLLQAVLGVPAVVAAVRMLGVPAFPGQWQILRVHLWARALLEAGPAVQGAALTLSGGTLALFVVQELLPSLRSRRTRQRTARHRDPRLDASLARVLAAFGSARIRFPRGRPPMILRVETDRSVAALVGSVQPVVVIATGLLDKLDQEELDAIVAHELGHLVQGGNPCLVRDWVFRALQAPSPAALVIFRSLMEAREIACDEIAARGTGRPAALASALLKVYGRQPVLTSEASATQRARAELDRRADVATTQRRVRALLDAGTRPSMRQAVAVGLATAVLGVILWAIG